MEMLTLWDDIVSRYHVVSNTKRIAVYDILGASVYTTGI